MCTVNVCCLLLPLLIATTTANADEATGVEQNLLSEIKEHRFAQEAARRDELHTVPARVYPNGRRPGRQTVQQKLNEIVVDSYEVPQARKLGDVIKDIAQLSRDRTRDRSGVNLILSSQMENPGLVGVQFSADSTQRSNPVRVADYEVTITPALRNVTLEALLGAIVEVAVPPKGSEGAPPLRYTIEDYAVVIGQRAPEPIPLFTRTFKVDPNTFTEGLDLVTRTNRESTQLNRADNTALQLRVRDFFIRAGVNFTTNAPAPPNSGTPARSQKAIFFNDRTGVLFVRATRAELDLVEKALQAVPLQSPAARGAR